jgi:ATP-dependent Clp protease ATP-binding subunit ClpX
MHLHFQVESGDLIAYGLIPEFIGRFPILVSLAALNEDQLVQVSLISSVVFS